MAGSIITQHYEEEHYKVLFNQQTGFFVRCEDAGFPEPIWSNHGPELLDISITNYCERGCDFCYRSSSKAGKHISIADYAFLLKQASTIGVFQIALGGGNPNQHPDFIKILEATREAGIVPSYTTNGEGLSEEILDATAKYCGAMAVSFYPSSGFDYYDELLRKTRDKGIKTNLHVIITNETIDVIDGIISDTPDWLDNVNAIIFLNFKPVGRGKAENEMLKVKADRAKRFFENLTGSNRKIGFDSCSISGITQWMDVRPEMIESCEAARFSAFISEDMKMYPCSFMADTVMFGDLRKQSMLSIWQENKYFKSFRIIEEPERCFGCQYYKGCKGGCRLFKEINFC